MLGQSLADLLDQNFRSRGSGSQSNALDAFEPGRVDIGGRIDEFGFDAAALSNFDKAVGIGTVLRADNQNKIDILRNLFDCFLAILGGVANVIAFRADNFRELLAEAGDDFLRIVKAKRSLCQKGEFFWVVHFELVHGLDRIDHDCAVGRFAGSANDFLVVFVSDQDDGAILARKFERFEVNFRHQRARGVDDFEGA